MSLTTPDTIRTLQRKLYAKAKQEPAYRFYALYDKISREDILSHAWRLVRSNRGSPGIDGISFEAIETGMGVETFLQDLARDLKDKTYRAQPVRRVMIPKADGSQRPLGIPTLRDRVAQMAVKLVIEPIFEADFCEHSYGFRPKKSAHDAVDDIANALWAGYTQVIDADLSKYFDSIPHAKLLAVVAERIFDGGILHLIKQWLKAPVIGEDDRGVKKTVGGGKGNGKGTPQGGVFTPRTQKITSSSIGKFPFIVLKRHLICVAGGHMLKAHVARHRFRKGTTGEQRLRSACSWSQPQRGRASIDRIIRVVASSGLSLPAGGTGTRAAAAGCPTDHSRHDQNPRRGRGGVARVCSRKRPDDGRDCWVRGIGVSGQGTPTWLIGAGRVMTCIWTMSLTACSPPSLSKSTRSWYRIGHAARGGRPG